LAGIATVFRRFNFFAGGLGVRPTSSPILDNGNSVQRSNRRIESVKLLTCPRKIWWTFWVLSSRPICCSSWAKKIQCRDTLLENKAYGERRNFNVLLLLYYSWFLP